MDISHDALGLTGRTTINQRDKGVKNERAVAKWLSEWCGSEFGRVPRSGAMRWKNNVDTIGDVVCTDTTFKFPFVIETKFYQKLNIKSDLGKRNLIYKFWAQVTADAARINNVKHRMLVIRHNDMPKAEWIVIVAVDVYIKICELAYNNGNDLSYFLIGETNGEHIYGFVSTHLCIAIEYKQLSKLLNE